MEILQVLRAIEAVKAQKPKLIAISKADHRVTKSTKETDQLTDKATSNLQSILNEIETFMKKNPDVTFKEVKDTFKTKVGSEIARTTRESFMIGFNYIEEYAGRTVELTPESISILNRKIEDAITRFWAMFEKEMIKSEQKLKSEVLGAGFGESLFVVFASFISAFMQTLTYATLDSGTVQAVQQKTVNESNDFRQIVTEYPDRLPKRFSESEEIQSAINQNRPLFAWITRGDDGVCPICLPLEGLRFEYEDPFAPKPIDDTHIGCRCRRLPIENGKVYIR